MEPCEVVPPDRRFAWSLYTVHVRVVVEHRAVGRDVRLEAVDVVHVGGGDELPESPYHRHARLVQEVGSGRVRERRQRFRYVECLTHDHRLRAPRHLQLKNQAPQSFTYRTLRILVQYYEVHHVNKWYDNSNNEYIVQRLSDVPKRVSTVTSIVSIVGVE